MAPIVNKKALVERVRGLGIKKPHAIYRLADQGGTPEAIDTLIQQTLEAQRAFEKRPRFVSRETRPDYPIYGAKIIEKEAIADMDRVASLPYVEAVALMADAHRVKEGHVPVGGVVQTSGDVILPGVVGNDIACSVRCTLTEQVVDDDWFKDAQDAIVYVLKNYAYFGTAYNSVPLEELQADPLFTRVVGPRMTEKLLSELRLDENRALVKGLMGAARNHFGTSGDGNHFLNVGMTSLKPASGDAKRFATNGSKMYLSLLSHFGSRGVGSEIAKVFLAKANELVVVPKGLEDNAPLFFGQEGWAEDYWTLMSWAGEFAAASHQWLHNRILTALKERGLYTPRKTGAIYTQHNFAWLEGGRYIHRKGATPSHQNEYGVIPATMGDLTQLVVGKGNTAYLDSVSHGAGRKMSRGVALKQIKSDTHEYVFKEYGVTLIGGDKDEDPRAYKRIDAVMKYQHDAVDKLGTFQPVVVRMADPRFMWKRKPG